MIKLPQIGIDPGISEGCISVLENGKLYNFRMKESFKDIKEILKPYGGAPNDTEIRCSVEQLNQRPNQNPFINSRMEPMRINYTRIQDVLSDLNIPFRLVAPQMWQKYHGLVLPKGVSEKGLSSEDLSKLKTELKHLKIHLSIENKTPNDEIIVGDIRHILETSGKGPARNAMCDSFSHFTKYDLNMAIKETDSAITKYKAKEKQIRKKRYQTYVTSVLRKEGYTEKIPRWQADSLLLLLYELNQQ